MTDRWQNADWDLFAMAAPMSAPSERCTSIYSPNAATVPEAIDKLFWSWTPWPPRAPGGAFASHCRDLRARLTASPQSIVPITTPTKQRTPWLPWLAATACALLALWLGARLDRASHQLRRLEASSQPAAHQQPPVTAPIATQPSQVADELRISPPIRPV